jgi:hypothetical protein
MEAFIRNHVLDFANTFVGYGDPKRRCWAIGLEERGCGTTKVPVPDEAQRRLQAWLGLGRPAWTNLQGFIENAGLNQPKDPRSPSWDALARIFCPLVGRNYADCCGTHFPNTIAEDLFLAELQPLPCQASGEWPWGNWIPNPPRDEQWEMLPSKDAWLRSSVLRHRAARLGALLRDHQPQVVICHGTVNTWGPLLAHLAKVAEWNVVDQGLAVITGRWPALGENNLIVVPQPNRNRVGIPASDFFDELGRRLAQ